MYGTDDQPYCTSCGGSLRSAADSCFCGGSSQYAARSAPVADEACPWCRYENGLALTVDQARQVMDEMEFRHEPPPVVA
jgi:hypothetical protein